MAATSVQEHPIEQGECLTWQAHPARQRPAAAAFGAAMIAGLAALCALLGANVWWAALAVALMVLHLNRFFFPSRFTIDAEGVTARYLLSTKRHAWSEIRRFCYDRRGVYLSTRCRRSRLDAYRGIHLLFGQEREEVLTGVRRRLAPNGEKTCGG